MISFFDRLDKYMKFKELNDNKMTLETGISNGLIGKARKRGSLSQENISKILHVYKDLNANWLLADRGEMILHVEKDPYKESKKDKDNDADLIDVQRKLIHKLEEEIEQLKKELDSETGYNLAAEPREELMRKKTHS